MQISELTTQTSTTATNTTEASIEDQNNKLFDAVKQNNLDKIKELVRNGANINAKNIDGKKPIHVAAQEGIKIL